ncbi:unnamed protein product [Effrenium voratum]|nr:unnamed protein product [Effrenium voratum]
MVALAAQAFYDYHQPRVPSKRRHLELRKDLVGLTKDISVDGKVRNWQDDVLVILSALPSLQLQADEVIFGAALGRLLQERQWQYALSTLDFMITGGLQANLITCSATVGACAKGLKWFRACGLLSQMRRLRIQPNTVAFDTAITACGGRSGSWENAAAVFGELRVLGLPPFSMSYNSAISSFEYRQKWQRGLDFLQDLVGQRGPRQRKANVVSFNAALSCCRRVSQWQQGLCLLKAIPREAAQQRDEELAPDEVTYGTAVSACDHGWVWRWAVQLLQAAACQGLKPSLQTSNAAISACGRRCQDDSAENSKVGKKGQEWQFCLDVLRDMSGAYVAHLSAIAQPGQDMESCTQQVELHQRPGRLCWDGHLKRSRGASAAAGDGPARSPAQRPSLRHRRGRLRGGGLQRVGPRAAAARRLEWPKICARGQGVLRGGRQARRPLWCGHRGGGRHRVARGPWGTAVARAAPQAVPPFAGQASAALHNRRRQRRRRRWLARACSGAPEQPGGRPHRRGAAAVVGASPGLLGAHGTQGWLWLHRCGGQGRRGPCCQGGGGHSHRGVVRGGLGGDGRTCSTGRAVGAEAKAQGSVLRPIFMVHDRASHAERGALLQVLMLAHRAALQLEVQQSTSALEAMQQEAMLWKQRAEVLLGRRKAVMSVAARWQGADAAWDWLMEQGTGPQELQELPEGAELRLQNRELCLSLRQFKQDCELLESENLSLKEALGCMEDDLHRVSDQHAQLVGHVNHRQKIRYTMKLKEEINRLCGELKKARQRIVQLEVSKESDSLFDALASVVGERPKPRGARLSVRPRRAPGKTTSRVPGTPDGEARLAEAEQLCMLQQSALDRISMDFQHLKALIERAVMLADTERRNGIEGGNFAALLHRLREIIAANHRTPRGGSQELGDLPVVATSIICDDDDVELAEGEAVCYPRSPDVAELS